MSEAASFVDTAYVSVDRGEPQASFVPVSLSANGMRAITAGPGRSVVCYGGASAECRFYGLHLGVHFNHEDGLHWLDHGYPAPRPIIPSWSPIRGVEGRLASRIGYPLGTPPPPETT